MNILVTGCGGDIGQSIGKILNQQNFILYGCDISDENAGKFIFTNFFISEPCSSKGYIAFIETLVAKHQIDIIIPIAEPELRFLSANSITDSIGGAKLIIATKQILKIGFDKLLTAQFLKNNNFPFPETDILSNVKKPNFPVILKSRTGSGSSQVYIVKNLKEYNYLKEKNPDFIVQEFLEGSNEEYTCGLYRSKQGEIRTIILKRKLTGGYSGYGEVVINNRIENLLIQIANKTALIGSINVQLRLTPKGPIIFEINPRFSSTVLFRHLFGFEDLLWSIDDLLGKPIKPYKKVNAGRKFYKGFNEYIE